MRTNRPLPGVNKPFSNSSNKRSRYAKNHHEKWRFGVAMCVNTILGLILWPALAWYLFFVDFFKLSDIFSLTFLI